MSVLQTIVTSLFHGHSVKTPAMPDFNLERYLGEWHEIARLENWFESGLRKVYARYDHGEDGTVSVTNGGYDARTGERREVHARARVADAPNHLKVYFVPVVYGRYEVAFVDEDYTRRRGVRRFPELFVAAGPESRCGRGPFGRDAALCAGPGV